MYTELLMKCFLLQSYVVLYGDGLVAKLCLTLMTPWTITRQAPLSLGFSRQEYWSGLPFPSPGELPNPGIEPRSPTLQADALLSEPPGKSKVEWTVKELRLAHIRPCNPQ